MDQIIDKGFVRVVLLLTPEQAKKLDHAARKFALSRSSFARTRFDELFMLATSVQQPDGRSGHAE